MVSLDDTQPRSPFRDQPSPLIDPQRDEEAGPGCLVWGFMGALLIGIAILIVLLAGMAGWTAGLRVAQANAAATRSAEIQVQLGRFPADVASGNLFLVQRRLEFLATQTPGVPSVPQLIQTATALYIISQPTATLTPTGTPTPTMPAPTLEITATVPGTTPVNSGYDLNALLTQARGYSATREWDQAIKTLDAIISIDPTFQKETIRGLMLQSLREQANALYGTGKLAEAMLLTSRAEEFGLDTNDPLRYERYVAGLYLDAKRTVGTDFPSSIRALRGVYDLGPGRYYEEVRQLLYQQYMGYGDAWVAQGEYCPAIIYYDSAVGIIATSDARAKRDNATTVCSQATPTLGPGVTPGTPAPAVAPIGQSGG